MTNEANIKSDSVLRSKHFTTKKSDNGDVYYVNDFGDIYQSGYNEKAQMLVTMLIIKEYDYYSSLRKDIIRAYKVLKTGEISIFDLAEFFDSGGYNIVIGSDSEENLFGVMTRIHIEK